MARVNPDSPRAIREALNAQGIALKKRWGQNFLVNRGGRDRILTALDAKPGDTVWEIGPGLGSLTAGILERGSRLVAFEIDRGLCRYLAEVFGGEEGFRIVPGDFLKTWPGEESAPGRIVGNLPYSSASLMISSLAEGGVAPVVMVFTVQKELAERITARPGTKEYSSFSVLCQTALRVRSRGDLQPGSFYPAPQVVSTVMEMSPAAGPGTAGGVDPRLVSLVARSLFGSRRKTLRNNALSGELCRRYPEAAVMTAIEAEGLDLARRAEEYAPEAFARIAARLPRMGTEETPPPS
jgi:16S rRNA (adenine1518-N6/adenine1519-N6)-dimethyltransferase